MTWSCEEEFRSGKKKKKKETEQFSSRAVAKEKLGSSVQFYSRCARIKQGELDGSSAEEKTRDDPAELLEIQAPGDSTGAGGASRGSPHSGLPHLWSHIPPQTKRQQGEQKSD